MVLFVERRCRVKNVKTYKHLVHKRSPVSYASVTVFKDIRDFVFEDRERERERRKLFGKDLLHQPSVTTPGKLKY